MVPQMAAPMGRCLLMVDSMVADSAASKAGMKEPSWQKGDLMAPPMVRCYVMAYSKVQKTEHTTGPHFLKAHRMGQRMVPRCVMVETMEPYLRLE